MGLARSATWNVGCCPELANSRLLTKGWAGSSVTGPGPEDGERNRSPYVSGTHPVATSGPRPGTLPASAAGAAPQNSRAALSTNPRNLADALDEDRLCIGKSPCLRRAQKSG